MVKKETEAKLNVWGHLKDFFLNNNIFRIKIASGTNEVKELYTSIFFFMCVYVYSYELKILLWVL